MEEITTFKRQSAETGFLNCSKLVYFARICRILLFCTSKDFVDLDMLVPYRLGPDFSWNAFPKRIVVSVFFLYLPFLIRGNGEMPRIVSFDESHYHGRSQTWDITQAPDGMMYFANSSGLLAFDGVEWQTHLLPEKQIVRSVACDQNGWIFTGAYGEFGYWKRNPGGFLAYTSLSAPFKNDHAGKEEIWHIVTGKGWVLFQSFSTIFLYDYQSVREITPPGNLMFIQKIGDKILVPVINKGIFEWIGNDVFRFVESTQNLQAYRIQGMAAWKNGFLVATEQGGIWESRPDTGTQYWENPVNKGFPNNQLNRILTLSNGALAVGSVQNGLYVFNSEGAFSYHINKVNGLQNNTILALYEDLAGDLWVGMDRGIDLVQLSDPLRYYSDINGKTGTVFTSRLINNILYLGTNQGLYKQIKDDFQLIPGTQGQIWEINIFDGQILCGHNNGTFRLEHGKPVWVSTVTGGWQTQKIPGDPDHLIQATYTGMVLFKKDKSGNWVFSHRINGLLAPLKQFCFDKEGYLWAVNPYKGMYRFRLNPEKDSVVNFKEFTAQDGLPTLFRLRLIDFEEKVFVLSDTVFYQWASAQNRLLPVSSLKGQNLSGVQNICPIGGNTVFFVKKDKIDWVESDRLIATLSLSLAVDNDRVLALEETSDELFFCLSTGYAILRKPYAFSLEERKYNYLPLTMITEVRINGHLAKNLEPFLPAGLPAPKLQPKENNLLFRFTTPVFSDPPQFRFKLEGFDTQWSAWQRTHIREYTNLPQGHYRFRVVSNTGNGEATFSFYILPRWYQTIWAKLILVGFLVLCAFSISRWHKYRLHKQWIILEKEREQQLNEERIRNKNEQLQLDIISKSKQLANSTFNLIRKNEILFQIKGELEQTKNDLGVRFPEKYYYRLLDLINRQLSDDQDWEVFETNFNMVHDEFFKQLKKDFPDLTPGELRLAAYLRMNLSTKEIAPLLNISVRGVENKRYRLRKKLNLDTDSNLTDYLLHV